MNATPLPLVDRRMLDAVNRAGAEGVSGPTPLPCTFSRLLEETWSLTEPRLGRLAIGMGLKGEEAADVLQDVYISAMQTRPPVKAAGELSRWLFRVTVNRCRLEHRRAQRRRRLWTSLVAAWWGEPRPDRRFIEEELAAHMDQALATLSDLDRSLVVMRYFVDLNSREIGEITSIPETTVRSRLRGARRQLAERLADWNEND